MDKLENRSGDTHMNGGKTAGDTGSTAKDPVCGMSVTSQSKHSLRHEGRTIYFCSAGCKTRFAADPRKYSAGSETRANEAGKNEAAVSGATYTCPCTRKSCATRPVIARSAAWRWCRWQERGKPTIQNCAI